jgi:hypothetical protein
VRLAHKAQDADTVYADLELEVDDTPEATLIDGPLVVEGSGEDRKNALKLHEVRRVDVTVSGSTAFV